jgi:hypothetical protein
MWGKRLAFNYPLDECQELDSMASVLKPFLSECCGLLCVWYEVLFRGTAFSVNKLMLGGKVDEKAYRAFAGVLSAVRWTQQVGGAGQI